MKVFDFDIKKGIYQFELNGLQTEIHSHPVVEIINAKQGTFFLEIDNQKIEGLTFAIIPSNTKHRVVSRNCTAQILMLESYNELLREFFSRINITNSFYLNEYTDRKEELFSDIRHFASGKNLKMPNEKRIQKCLQIIENNDIEYSNLIVSLTSEIFLSESRLSHLFKQHIGTSLKRYLVWNKLRRAIHSFLSSNTNLTDASLQSGFFDQAHLSKSFKDILGVSPSKAYNSRTLQF